jgi:hypothetical protein
VALRVRLVACDADDPPEHYRRLAPIDDGTPGTALAGELAASDDDEQALVELLARIGRQTGLELTMQGVTVAPFETLGAVTVDATLTPWGPVLVTALDNVRRGYAHLLCDVTFDVAGTIASGEEFGTSATAWPIERTVDGFLDVAPDGSDD